MLSLAVRVCPQVALQQQAHRVQCCMSALQHWNVLACLESCQLQQLLLSVSVIHTTYAQRRWIVTCPCCNVRILSSKIMQKPNSSDGKTCQHHTLRICFLLSANTSANCSMRASMPQKTCTSIYWYIVCTIRVLDSIENIILWA